MSGLRIERAKAAPGRPLRESILSGTFSDAFLFERPGAGLSIAAVGVAAEARSSGPERFIEIEETRRRLFDAAIADASIGQAPLFVGGVAFGDTIGDGSAWAGLGAARFVVPEILEWRRDGEIERWRVGGGQGTHPSLGYRRPAPPDESRESFERRVEQAVRRIRSGGIEKIVLSRARSAPRAEAPPVRALFERAVEERPGCSTFLVQRGDVVFLGSTPETLVSTDGRVARADAIAGSGRRGKTPKEDESLGAALLACPKNAREHEFVVRSIRETLEPLGRTATRGPELLRLPELFHLFTSVETALDEPRLVLDLADRLHPTPAVSGWPRATASELLAAEEPDRGWYTGTLGWVDPAGAGEMVVALRSALFTPDSMIVHAGSGIVEGSEPGAEWLETEAKLEALHAQGKRSPRAA